MKQNKILPFTVEGRGEFPTDMLRYDVCEFATPKDEKAAGKGYADPEFDSSRRKVTLLSTSSNLHNKPTVDRWVSFGWSVVEVEKAQIIGMYRDTHSE